MSSTSNKTPASYLVQARQSGEQSSILSLTRTNPGLIAQITKLQTPIMPPMHNSKGQRTPQVPLQAELQNISASVSQKDSDAETQMQLFPEIKLACEILVASVMSPNDMYTEELSFSINDGLHCQPLQASLIPLVKTYLTEKYNLLQTLPEILKEALFGSGSYALAVIPESSVDDLINGDVALSKESMSIHMEDNGRFKPVGYLGGGLNKVDKGSNFSIESFVAAERFGAQNLTPSQMVFADNGVEIQVPHLTVTDNPDALKLPSIIDRQREELQITLTNKRLGLESVMGSKNTSPGLMDRKINDRELTALLYRNTRRKQVPMVKIKTGNEVSRYTVGAPLILHLPSESVIPCFPPGQPQHPVGYYVVLDSEGNPLSRKNHKDHFENMRNLGKNTAGNTNGDMSSFLMNKAGQAFGGNCSDSSFVQASRIYADLVEADLLARLRNGVFGNEVTISNNQEVYRLMLARALSKQNTQVLFIPRDMLTYFAYQFNDDGTGKSLLEDTRMLGAMRAQLLFVRVMGAVKNAIGRRLVNITVDEDDPDPRATRDQVIAEVVRATQHVSPASSLNPSDVLNQVQTMGLEFQTSGNPGLPDTKVEFSEHNSSHQPPDESLDEDLRKRILGGVGVPPELVDDASRPEFASVAATSHLLLAKRVRTIQEAIAPMITKAARSLVSADGTFVIELKKVITENLSTITEQENLPEELVELKNNPSLLVHVLAMEFLSNFNATLAKPDVKSMQTQLEAVTVHEEIYDKVIGYFISNDVLDASIIGEEASARLDAMKGAAKAAYMRRWLASNGIVPEIFELVTISEDGRPAFDVKADMTQHTEAIALSILGVLKKTTPVAAASDLELSKLKTEAPSGGDDSTGGSDGNFDTTDGNDPTTTGDVDDMSFPDLS